MRWIDQCENLRLLVGMNGWGCHFLSYRVLENELVVRLVHFGTC